MTNHNAMQSTLGKAIAIWATGGNINFAMATELREQGYDVASLAHAHRRFGQREYAKNTEAAH